MTTQSLSFNPAINQYYVQFCVTPWLDISDYDDGGENVGFVANGSSPCP